MRKISIFAAVAALLATGISCGKIGGDDSKNNPYKRMDLTTKSQQFVREGEVFTFNFIDRINDATKGNYIISPLSMQFLLGMILNGAQGQTAGQICDVLGYGAGEVDAVNEYCLSMLQQLPSMDKKTKLNIANAIFVDDGWPLKETYVSNVSRYYQAEVANLDFSDGAGSLNTINGWCSKHTGGMIPKVLDKVDPEMLAYLLNAMYFKSEWKEKFKKSVTTDEDFTDESGAKSKVKMMKQEKKYQYQDNDVFQIVKIPYGNSVFSMIALLPTGGHSVSDITEYLTTASWEEVRGSMVTCEVDLWLPKFETKFRINLNDILSGMGMPLAFDRANADFKALSDYAESLRFVQQDAIIKVDEEGSEAAVVSSAGFGKLTDAGPDDHVVFHADHPFLYLITESSTGAVLFAGKYGG